MSQRSVKARKSPEKVEEKQDQKKSSKPFIPKLSFPVKTDEQLKMPDLQMPEYFNVCDIDFKN